MRNKIIFFFIGSILFSSCNKSVETYENYVVLVSFDGFRWDYQELYDLPNFKRLEKEGVRAEEMIPAFPTKTFPNHYSIVTGLYPDHHGIINNSFYAQDLGLFYRIGDREMVQDADFYGGEPIWNTAEKQDMISASFYWVGSEAPIQDLQPRYWKIYNERVSFAGRVDTVIRWLKKPIDKRPRLILLYFQQPDGAGHDYGPVSMETGTVLKEMDNILGILRKKISRLPYGNRVNLIITSDHGMGEISSERYINMNKYIHADWVEDIEGGNPVYLIDAANGFEDSIVNHLDVVDGISAWKKESIPAHLRYGSNPRIPDILVVADSSWSVGIQADPSGYNGGTHGYDNSNTDMHTIFYAVGPAFKAAYRQAAFENVDIYPLIAHILGLIPAETDGKLEDVEGMLN